MNNENQSFLLSELCMRPENELLLYCARANIDLKTHERIKLLLQCGNIDWDYLIYIAVKHGVAQLLFHSLSEFPKSFPEVASEKLHDLFCANAVHNLTLSGELLKISKILISNNIESIPFKGTVLAISAYKNIAFRKSSDIDILVRKQDILEARDLLIRQGYKLIYPDIKLNPLQEDIYLERKHEYAFLCKHNQVTVELQWSCLDSRFSVPFQVEKLWDQCKKIPFYSTEIISPSDEDMLLILCLESYKDHWRSLKRICDVAEFVRTHPDLKWEKVLEKSESLRVKRIFYINSILSSRLLGLELPDFIFQKIIDDSNAISLSKTIMKWLLDEPDNFFEAFKMSFFPFVHLGARDCIQDKIKICFFSMLPNEKDWKFLPLPSVLQFLYYLVRPIRLVIILGSIFARKISKIAK